MVLFSSCLCLCVMLPHSPTTPDPWGFNLSSTFLLLPISGGVLPHQPGPAPGLSLFWRQSSCHGHLFGCQAEDDLDCGDIKKVKRVHCILASRALRSQQRRKRPCVVMWPEATRGQDAMSPFSIYQSWPPCWMVLWYIGYEWLSLHAWSKASIVAQKGQTGSVKSIYFPVANLKCCWF